MSVSQAPRLSVQLFKPLRWASCCPLPPPVNHVGHAETFLRSPDISKLPKGNLNVDPLSSVILILGPLPPPQEQNYTIPPILGNLVHTSGRKPEACALFIGYFSEDGIQGLGFSEDVSSILIQRARETYIGQSKIVLSFRINKSMNKCSKRHN